MAVVPTVTIHHPVVGRLELLLETFAIPAAEGQLLVVNHAEPGSPSERALSHLAAGLA